MRETREIEMRNGKAQKRKPRNWDQQHDGAYLPVRLWIDNLRCFQNNNKIYAAIDDIIRIYGVSVALNVGDHKRFVQDLGIANFWFLSQEVEVLIGIEGIERIKWLNECVQCPKCS